MTQATQKGFFLNIGDAASPEVYTTIEGLREEVPSIKPATMTLRNSRYVGDSGDTITKKFNQLKDGAEISLALDYIVNAANQELLKAARGVDAGINIRTGIVGAAYTHTITVNVLVQDFEIQGASANDAEGVDTITFTLVMNADATETTLVNS